MRVRLSVRGTQDLNRRLSEIANRVPDAHGRALYAEGSNIMNKAKTDPQFPVDTGALRASGFVEPPKNEGDKVTVTIGFGGPAAPYALYVHEGTKNMSARKYLERPVLEAQSGYEGRIARRIKHELGM